MTVDNVLICLLCLITLMVSFSSTSSIRDIIHNCRCSREERNWKNIFNIFVKDIVNIILLNIVKDFCKGMFFQSINELNNDFYNIMDSSDTNSINHKKVVKSIIENNKYKPTKSILI